jgi:hypothetical protein
MRENHIGKRVLLYCESFTDPNGTPFESELRTACLRPPLRSRRRKI